MVICDEEDIVSRMDESKWLHLASFFGWHEVIGMQICSFC